MARLCDGDNLLAYCHNNHKSPDWKVPALKIEG
jgi:hypothetical protein